MRPSSSARPEKVRSMRKSGRRRILLSEAMEQKNRGSRERATFAPCPPSWRSGRSARSASSSLPTAPSPPNNGTKINMRRSESATAAPLPPPPLRHRRNARNAATPQAKTASARRSGPKGQMTRERAATAPQPATPRRQLTRPSRRLAQGAARRSPSKPFPSGNGQRPPVGNGYARAARRTGTEKVTKCPTTHSCLPKRKQCATSCRPLPT